MWYLVSEFREAHPDLPRRDKSHGGEGDLAGEEGFAGAERDGADLDDDVVEQPRVVELPHQVAAADGPDVLAPGGFDHCLMNRTDVSFNETDIGAGNGGQRPAGEDPSRLRVGPGGAHVGLELD